MDKVLSVLLQSVAAFAFLFITSKILGKKQVAQLEFSDYVIGISIGSIAAQMAVEPDIPLFHFLVAIAIFAAFDLFITLIARKSVFLKKFFKGKPLVIVNKGEIDYAQLKKSKLDVNELVSMCRVSGYFNLDQVDYCLFEPSGKFSIMPKDKNKPVEKQDFKIKESNFLLPLHLVIDGKVVKQALQNSGKTLSWVLEQANAQNTKQLKNVLLLSYFEGDNSVSVFYKKQP